MTIAHNHPPRCCCGPDDLPGHCPACPEHGALTHSDECLSCHQPADRPHTDYCQTGIQDEIDPTRPTTLTDTGTMFATVPTKIQHLALPGGEVACGVSYSGRTSTIHPASVNCPHCFATTHTPREPDPPLCVRCLHTIHHGECPLCYCSHH